jgi:hypothetical protein
MDAVEALLPYRNATIQLFTRYIASLTSLKKRLKVKECALL